MQMDNLDTMIAVRGEESSQLIGILQDIQAEYNYLPLAALMRVSERLNVPFSQLYSIATFFKAFSLEPRGKHIVTVCLGTACHVRQAPRIVDEISRALGIKAGETTPDKQFTLETVNCLGTCALGPVAVIDGKYYGKMTAKKIGALLKQYGKE
jgi:NADH:ubiquinone oxidoreductase subunit E